MSSELPDTAEAMEAKETARRLPAGWLALFFGLIAWGAWYLWTYSPWSTGWTQEAEYQAATQAPAQAAGVGSSIFGTILFTALPATAAILLILRVRRQGSGRGP